MSGGASSSSYLEGEVVESGLRGAPGEQPGQEGQEEPTEEAGTAASPSWRHLHTSVNISLRSSLPVVKDHPRPAPPRRRKKARASRDLPVRRTIERPGGEKERRCFLRAWRESGLLKGRPLPSLKGAATLYVCIYVNILIIVYFI